jgi:hypothetical protein
VFENPLAFTGFASLQNHRMQGGLRRAPGTFRIREGRAEDFRGRREEFVFLLPRKFSGLWIS